MRKLIVTPRFKRLYSGNARVSAAAGALRVGRMQIQQRRASKELQKVRAVIREGETLVHQLTSSLSQIVERAPIRSYDPVQERLRQRAVTAILNGAEWLTSTEVDRLIPGSGTRINAHARANRLLSEGKVFAIEHGGKKRYPRYVFDPRGNPYPAVRDVLQLFGKASPLRVASWFESSSAALNGRRPREVLEADPTAVVQAAREHITGPVHG